MNLFLLESVPSLIIAWFGALWADQAQIIELKVGEKIESYLWETI